MAKSRNYYSDLAALMSKAHVVEEFADDKDENKENQASISNAACALPESDAANLPSTSKVADDTLTAAEKSEKEEASGERHCVMVPFLNMDALKARLNAAFAKHGIKSMCKDVPTVISIACEEIVQGLLESTILGAAVRTRSLQDCHPDDAKVCLQLQFLKEVDEAQMRKAEQQKQDETASQNTTVRSQRKKQQDLHAKSRTEDALNQKEMQEERVRKTNETLSQALGPQRRILKTNIGDKPPAPKLRVTMEDLIFTMENDPHFSRSTLLYAAYLKSPTKIMH